MITGVRRHVIERLYKRRRGAGMRKLKRQLREELGDDWRIVDSFTRPGTPRGLFVSHGLFMVELHAVFVPRVRRWRQVAPISSIGKRGSRGPSHGNGWVGTMCSQIVAAHRGWLEEQGE